MNIPKKTTFVIFIMAFPLFFLFVFRANAAAVIVAVDHGAVAQNQIVRVTVSLDAQEEDANAIQAEVTFPPDMFAFKKISDGSSAVSLWIIPPKESSPGVIDLAGVMPGGFTGADGSLFSFELQPLGVGSGTIQVASATVLANDGLGSSLLVTLGSASVNVAAASPASASSAPQADYTSPNPFTPQIASDPNMFNGKYFLVFSATDNESGIDHYEVLEVPSGSSEQPFSSWHEAISPYLLTDQDLSSDIYVRAVDHNGNFIVVKLPARHPSVRWNGWELFAVIAFVLVLVVSLLIWMDHRRRHL